MMKSTYTGPELVRFGSIEALTASVIKCTPGEDDGLTGHDHKEFDDPSPTAEAGDKIWVPELHSGEAPGTINCGNRGEII